MGSVRHDTPTQEIDDDMRLFLFCLLTALALALTTGCASSGYFPSRLRDAGDVFTLALGSGVGAKARVGPIQPALMIDHDVAGLRAGEFFLSGYKVKDLQQNYEMYMPLGLSDELNSFGFGYYKPGEVGRKRHKAIHEYSPVPWIVVPTPDKSRAAAAGPTSPAQYTQIEVAGGFILTLRAGFNPGELLDFLLGWFTLDLYDDDF